MTNIAKSGRQGDINGFATSGEFGALVSSIYGTDGTEDTRTQRFVRDMYDGATGSDPTAAQSQQAVQTLDAAAAQGQAQVIAAAQNLGTTLMQPQVTNTGISDTQFVTNLYTTFLQRGPDTAGLNYWVSQCSNGNNRASVMNQFATSSAFEQLAGTLYRELYWLTPDHLGTARMIVDKSGSLASVKRHDYLPFGEELYAGVGGRTTGQGYVGDDVRQKFTGKERDNETGMDYFGARYYANLQGRLLSADPVHFTTERLYDPQQIDLYSYCRNNPLKYTDPNGRDVKLDPKLKPAEADRIIKLAAKAYSKDLGREAIRKMADSKLTFTFTVGSLPGSIYGKTSVAVDETSDRKTGKVTNIEPKSVSITLDLTKADNSKGEVTDQHVMDHEILHGEHAADNPVEEYLNSKGVYGDETYKQYETATDQLANLMDEQEPSIDSATAEAEVRKLFGLSPEKGSPAKSESERKPESKKKPEE